MLDSISSYLMNMGMLEFVSFVFGLLCVYFLIRENILTWICGIIYVLISFYVFWQARLYGDFILHIVYLVLNIYGWYNWSNGRKATESDKMPITISSVRSSVILLLASIVGIFVFAQLLIGMSDVFSVSEAALPYWDSTTTILSLTGMWLTTQKKLDNWIYWLVVDILATGIYFYKGIYFYSLLYFIYIGMAVAGFIAWKKSMQEDHGSL